MAEKPTISIIIPAYNSDYIEACLDSCLDQSLDGGAIEIIIVNDASTDDTGERVTRMIEGKNNMRLLHHDENQGPAAARNTGMEAARGEFISFLDSDDMMVPDKLKRQLAYCREHPQIKAVISGILEIASSGEPIRELVREFSNDVDAQIETIFLDNLHTITSTLFFECSLLEQTGMMDPKLKNLEDMDFALKLLQHGQLYYYPECLTTRRILSSGLSYTVSEELFVQSRQEFFNNALERHPFLEKRSRRYWSLNYARLGRILQRQSQGLRGRHYYLLSLRKRVNMVGLLGLCLSFFPGKIQRQLASNVWRSH